MLIILDNGVFPGALRFFIERLVRLGVMQSMSVQATDFYNSMFWLDLEPVFFNTARLLLYFQILYSCAPDSLIHSRPLCRLARR